MTIVIPVFNGATTITRAIESCLNQSYKNIEIVVIDNGSTDTTKEKVQIIMAAHSCVKYIFTQTKGRSNARNIGIDYASGEYITFLDVDDTLAATGLENAVGFLDLHSEYTAFSQSIEYINILNKSRKKELINKNIEELQFRNLFPINSVLIRNNELILFDVTLDYCEDWLFWFNNLWNKKVKVNNSTVAGMVYITGENSMRNTRIMSRYRAVVRAEIIKSTDKYQQSMYLKDIKLCLTYLWSYGTKEKRSVELDKIMKKGFNGKFIFCTVLYKFSAFKYVYNLKKDKQESLNYYVTKQK
ncbi:glycosyltransferase family 2 protein [Latilactobacillus sakei]|uniref:glycosyltransferase family 2 protein n=1 Tax=Latilactobacillus sakei TaxID=1599 RepID=UPI002073EF6F|nr:glycosyltransferase family 2 protein [Latilactobacillus sakei]